MATLLSVKNLSDSIQLVEIQCFQEILGTDPIATWCLGLPHCKLSAPITVTIIHQLYSWKVMQHMKLPQHPLTLQPQLASSHPDLT